MSDQPQIFTLRQVVSSIRKTIEERYNREYWVKAEMHKLGQTRSGHCYPELVQKEDGKIVAEMRGTIWAHQFERINERFIKVVKEPLKEDTTLLMKVKVSFHEIYGMSLQILDIDPNYALGELQRERTETLKRLQKDGLLDANQKVAFPMLPKRVAVISAESSKGLSDFMQVIEQNTWNYTFFTMLFPATLQGDQAEHTIIAQLEKIKRVRDHFDIVVIVRGGGGEVGMSCYNNYNLCKAIASFPLPVLTGIGHSTNLTVAEMISFRNAITPTELGEFLIQAFHNFSVPLKDAAKSIRVHTKNLLDQERSLFSQASQGFKHSTQHYLTSNNHSLVNLGKSLKSSVHDSLHHRRERLGRIAQQSTGATKIVFQKHHSLLDQTLRELPIHGKTILKDARVNLENIEQSIRLMNPKNVLLRGYSITTINGKSVSEQNDIEVGDEILTKTADFDLTSTVKSKKDAN
ncbi:MAG: exodeoxyribonuclease VII large subunit [Crocinitomicaceae bacterium]|nr:exodeoxyribonuclease VII large subunit [Crocinitomicaceae bacterium]